MNRTGALRRVGGVVGGMALAAGAASAQPRPAETLPTLKVVVTVPPLKGLVEPLLPLGSEVRVLMAPGRSEHGYEFTPADVRAVAEADIVAYIGLGLEPRIKEVLGKGGAPGRQAVGFGRAVGLEGDEPAETPKEAEEGTKDHDHHDHDGHDHDGHDHDGHHHGPIDPHLWLDPVLCMDYAGAMGAAVVKALESKADLTELQRQELARAEAVHTVALGRMEAKWRSALQPFAGRAIVTHHAAFGRPAERYGIRIAASVRGREGAEPGPGEIQSLVEAVRREKVGTIFVEPQFDAKAARRIAAACGAEVATLDPLGDGDWFKLMEANLAALVDSFKREDAAREKEAEKAGGKKKDAGGGGAPGGGSMPGGRP
jgi:zinc transport system substrate-binding protein